MLERFYVIVTVIALGTEATITNSDVIPMSAKLDQEVKFVCPRRSENEVMYWNIVTSRTEKIINDFCHERSRAPLGVTKRCIDTDYGGFDLIITVQKEDSGTYECIAAKPEEVLKAYDLRIESKAVIPEAAYTKDAVIQEGDTVKLWCNATGFPLPSISWEISETDSKGKVSFHDIGIRGKLLQIRNVSRHCSTSYRCIATNKLSMTSAIQNIKIRVNFGALADIDVYSEKHCGTTMEDLGEKIHVNSTGDSYVEKRAGLMVSLVCSGSGSPSAIIHWYKFHNGKLIKISTLGHGDESDDNKELGSFETKRCPPLFNDERRFRLTFQVFDDRFTRYVCKTSNEFGNDEMAITIKQVT